MTRSRHELRAFDNAGLEELEIRTAPTASARGRAFTAVDERASPGQPVNRAQLIEFVRRRGLAIVATRDPSGAPEAALVGIAVTDRAELVFDTAARSRKCVNLQAFPRVAVVIGWDDELTVQGEGVADVLAGRERTRCLAAYVEQYPDGIERAEDPEIVLVRVRLDWVRRCDYRRESFGIEEGALED